MRGLTSSIFGKLVGLAVNKPTGVCVRGFVVLAPLFNFFLGEWGVDDEVEGEEERELGLLRVDLQHLVGQVATHRNGLDARAGLVNHLRKNQNNPRENVITVSGACMQLFVRCMEMLSRIWKSQTSLI